MVAKRTTSRRASTAKRSTAKRATAKRSTAKRATSRSTTKRGATQAFGGYAISFKGEMSTLEQVFGKDPVSPSEMTKKIWAFVKRRKLSNR